jgi:hypothetical protein
VACVDREGGGVGGGTRSYLPVPKPGASCERAMQLAAIIGQRLDGTSNCTVSFTSEALRHKLKVKLGQTAMSGRIKVRYSQRLLSDQFFCAVGRWTWIQAHSTVRAFNSPYGSVEQRALRFLSGNTFQ